MQRLRGGGCGASVPQPTAQAAHVAPESTSRSTEQTNERDRTLRKGRRGDSRFWEADKDRSGGLGKDELASALRMEISEIHSIFHNLDTDGDGQISLAEWAAGANWLEEQEGVAWINESKPYPVLNDNTRTILFNLLGFLASRRAFEEMVREHLPKSFMDSVESFSHDEHLRQERLDQGGRARDYGELHAVGCAGLELFTSTVHDLVTRADLDPAADVMFHGEPLMRKPDEPFKVRIQGSHTVPRGPAHCHSPGLTHRTTWPSPRRACPLLTVARARRVLQVLTIGPLKAQERCDQKAIKEYQNDYSRIVDFLRCSVVVNTEAQLARFAHVLAQTGGDLSWLREGATSPPASREGASPRFVVLRLKNRYATPVFNGYRDALYNIALEIRPGFWAVAEVPP